MNFTFQKINRRLLIFGFILANGLWINTLIDFYQFGFREPEFSFPDFFVPLFILGALLSISLSIFFMRNIRESAAFGAVRPDPWILFIWLAIPISVLCTAPVCYVGNIMHSPYWMSTLIRWLVLIVPLIAGLLYILGYRELAIFILLLLGFFSLLPNDECYNPFNHAWIDRIGASPLTYLPSFFVMLFGITALYGKNKYLLTAVVYGLCFGALIISLGHRLSIIW